MEEKHGRGWEICLARPGIGVLELHLQNVKLQLTEITHIF